MLHAIADILISPINASLLVACFGAVLLTLTKLKPWIGKCLIWISIIWVTLCSQFMFSYWLVAPLEKAFPSMQVQSKQWQSADAIWVLACYHFDSESLPLVSQFNNCSIERLVQAANMYRLKPIPIYLTGGSFIANSKLVHARQAAKFLMELGVNESDINVVNTGSNTREEALALAEYISDQNLAVVSSATHGIRLSKILANSGINFTFVPVHYAAKGDIVYSLNLPSSLALLRSERALYEYAALIEYWFMFE